MSQHNRPRILIINHDVVGRRMAGPGIRAWHMARVLAAHGAVTLIAPRPIDLQAPDFACGDYSWGDAASLAGWLERADVVVANGFVLEVHPELANVPQPLALDLYDPVLLENLELMREQPPEARAARAATDQQLLARQLAAGDFFLCATERQRDLYLGALMLAGRLTPAQIDADATARALIDVAPFGLDPTPPVRQGPALRGVLPGIGADDPLLLWTGGLWDWLDPLTLIDAMPRVAEQHPTARLVFLAGRHPGAATAMRMPERARARAAECGLLGTHIFFYDEWVPYERRADFLLDATIAVSLHRNHLETAYAAVRSRFLDHLWAGLPSLVSDGDAAADLVRAHALGAVVPPGDAVTTAAALLALLNKPDELAACGARARTLAQEFAWERALGPLVGWVPLATIATPIQAKEMLVAERVEAQPSQPDLDVRALTALIDQAEQLWEISKSSTNGTFAPKELLSSLVQQASSRIYSQQTQMNAVVVQALYWIISEAQRAETRSGNLQHQIWHLEQQINTLHNVLNHVLPELNNRITEEEYSTTALSSALALLSLEKHE